MKQVTAKWVTVKYPTYTRQPERQLPAVFSDGRGDLYPDTLDDILDGKKTVQKYRAIVMENRHLRLTIMPELGGKLWSVYDKNARQETVYVPDVIKPGLINLPGAWIPGGMEFNFPMGHHMYGMHTLPCRIVEKGAGKVSAQITNRCRRTGLVMEVLISLAADEARFDIGFTISNPTALRRGWYLWNNVGILAHDGWRFFSKAKHRVQCGDIKPFPIDEKGVDRSWYKNQVVTADNFQALHREDFFGCYDYLREHGVVHVAPWREFPGKKFFTWGTEYRADDASTSFCDNGESYVEIQAGPMETQSNRDWLLPGERRAFRTTWMPFSKLGGIEWANRDLVFHVRDGVPWIFASKALTAEIQLGLRVFRKKMLPGKPVRLPTKVAPGTDIGISIDGILQRVFRFPLESIQEPRPSKRQVPFHDGIHRTQNTAEKAFEFGHGALQWEKRDRAIASLRKALSLSPSLHEARYDLANALFQAGEFDAGETELRRLLKTPFAFNASEMLARRPVAEAEFMAPFAGMPSGKARDVAIAEHYAGHGAYESAFRLYTKLLRTDARNFRVHYGLARYHAWMGNTGKSTRHADRALELRPGHRDLVIELCPIYAGAGRYDRVVEAISGCKPSVRNLSILQKHLANAYFELGEYRKSLAISTTALLYSWEGDMNQADIYIGCCLALTEAALDAGDLDEAERMADAAVKIPKGLRILRRVMGASVPAYWRGRVAMERGDKVRAKQLWSDALDSTDKEVFAFEYATGSEAFFALTYEGIFHYGMCALMLGDRQRLRRSIEYTLAIEGIDRKKKRWYLKGIRHELLGNFKQAERWFAMELSGGMRTRRIRLHYEAVKRGHRRGERAGQ